MHITDIEKMHLGVEESESDHDGNICDDKELTKQFNSPYQLVTEEAVSLKENYVLCMTGACDELKVGIGLSDNNCAVYQITDTHLSKVASFPAHNDTICNVKFNAEDSNLLYSGSVDGTIKLWDLRQQTDKCVKEYKDDTIAPNKLKPILSFDISKNSILLCAGTELVEGSAFILFWDLRNSSLLGGYWESHTDDITQVRFHKTNSSTLASGSTDGLINVFDLNEITEEDALLYSHNTESSVDKINWFSADGKTDAINCITHTECLQLWKIEDNTSYVNLTRNELCKYMKRKSADDFYLANVHEMNEDGELLIVAGSNASKGECLRTLTIKDKTTEPHAQLQGNKQIVRSSWYNNQLKLLVTGGENGIVSVWRSGLPSEETMSRELRSESKLKKTSVKMKPY